jgi:hypothetical protein
VRTEIKHEDIIVKAVAAIRPIPGLTVGAFTGQVDKFIARQIVPDPSAWVTVKASNPKPIGDGGGYEVDLRILVMLLTRMLDPETDPLGETGTHEYVRLIRRALDGNELGYDHQLWPIVVGPEDIYLADDTKEIRQLDFLTKYDTSF